MLSWGGSLERSRCDDVTRGCGRGGGLACADAELVRAPGQYSKFEIERELQLPRNTRLVWSIERRER